MVYIQIGMHDEVARSPMATGESRLGEGVVMAIVPWEGLTTLGTPVSHFIHPVCVFSIKFVA
ncbi:MAG: hypothetical protein ABI557_03920 [Aureliella sp.]